MSPIRDFRAPLRPCTVGSRHHLLRSPAIPQVASGPSPSTSSITRRSSSCLSGSRQASLAGSIGVDFHSSNIRSIAASCAGPSAFTSSTRIAMTTERSACPIRAGSGRLRSSGISTPCSYS